MSYYNFYEDHDVYGQPTTPSIKNFEDDFDTSNSFSNNDEFLTRFENNDVYYPQSTPSSMRSLNYHNDDHSADIKNFFFLYALISLGVPIICWITCSGRGLVVLGICRICPLAVFLLLYVDFRFAGFELLGGILWIVIGLTIIYKRRSDREQRERVERFPEDVEDPIVLTTTEDNLPTAVADHRINSRLLREDMRTTLQGRVNYHEIVHAKIVDMGSSSTSTQVGDPQNIPSWSPHEEAEYSGPAAIAVPERVVGMGLESHSNRIEEMVINCPRFTFAVAGSIEMANLNVRQLNQHQNVDTFERGMSLFDRYSNQEKDENEIV
jgi:hypothetical protein